MQTQTLPNTIDGVILRLEEIIRDCVQRGDRAGYFAALYHRVTVAVRDGIAKGRFDDGPRMERLDVIFANRYLAAYDLFRSGELPSRSWLRAFCAEDDGRLIVLQHLLAGMNAHINLDLGIAAARVAPGAKLAALLGDFNRINQLLAQLTPVVEQRLDGISPVFGVLSSLAPKLELKMIGFSMDRARAEAWALAQRLAPLPQAEQLKVIAARDLEVALIADVVLNDGLLVRAIRREEHTDVRANIQALCDGSFRVRIAPTILAPQN
ncbi:MAG TPA: DUF5995 family protein [Longimicrobium sp.]|jgi:hypothetical protein